MVLVQDWSNEKGLRQIFEQLLHVKRGASTLSGGAHGGATEKGLSIPTGPGRPASPTTTLLPGDYDWGEGGDGRVEEQMNPMPRAHHGRKSAHPHRAPESIAEDSADPDPSLRASSPTLVPLGRFHHLGVHVLERAHLPHSHTKRHAGIRKSPPRSTPARTGAFAANKECHDCHTLKTPMWRRVGEHNYCNACGLRRKRAESGR